MQLNSEFLETSESEKSKFRYGRVLLMDDDDLVREITELMLERLGYDSEVSQEGTEAMNLYEKAMNSVYPFNAVIIDLKVKAGLDGLDTINGLKVMDPQVKAIVSSGFTNDPVMTNFKEYGFQGVLPKPYKMKDIEDALFKISTEREN
jgi:CheY-like chemotaxis protein